MPHHTPPSTLADELRQLTAVELSLPSRLRYVGLLLAASTMTAIVTALLLTEPALPTRTSIALGILAGIGGCWMAFAFWVLARKRILLGSHRVVAGRMAVAFTSVFFIGAVSIALTTSSASAWAASVMGAFMLAAAVAMLMRARREVTRLMKRRDELQQQRERSHQ
jgi:membrane associated rhomboid family serine protease